MSTEFVRDPARPTVVDGASLRVSASLLLAGQLLYVIVTQFHAGGNANDHQEIFSTYARNDLWKAVHVGQFLAMGLIIAGLLSLLSFIDFPTRGSNWLGRLGAASAIAALTLFAVLQAVDGVGNKEVDAAWADASSDEKPARLASAEGMRWLEWGARSYHDYALGLALMLVAAAMLRSRRTVSAIAYLVGLSGIAYLVQGWIVGAEGFSDAHTIMILAAWLLSLAWMIWLAVLAWRSDGADVSRTAG